MAGFWSDFLEWAAHPFSEDMPASHWFMLIGMLIVFAVLWRLILNSILEAIADA